MRSTLVKLATNFTLETMVKLARALDGELTVEARGKPNKHPQDIAA